MCVCFFVWSVVLPYYARKSFAWSVRARLFAGVCDACPLGGRFVGVGVCSLLRCSPAAAATGSASTCSSQLLVQSPEGGALAAAGGGATGAWGCVDVSSVSYLFPSVDMEMAVLGLASFNARAFCLRSLVLENVRYI